MSCFSFSNIREHALVKLKNVLGSGRSVLLLKTLKNKKWPAKQPEKNPQKSLFFSLKNIPTFSLRLTTLTLEILKIAFFSWGGGKRTLFP